jgi:hypothetical protein
LQLHEKRMLWPLRKQRLQASLHSAHGSLRADAQKVSAYATRRVAHAAHASSWRLGKFEVILIVNTAILICVSSSAPPVTDG